MDGLRAAYGRVHKAVGAVDPKPRLRSQDGEALLMGSNLEHLEDAVSSLLEEHPVLTAQGLQLSASRDCGVFGLSRSSLPTDRFLEYLQGSSFECRYSDVCSGWLVSASLSALDKYEAKHTEEQARSAAKAEQEESDMRTALERAQTSATALWELFASPFNPKSQVAAYSAVTAWGQSNAHLVLAFFENGYFVLKIRHATFVSSVEQVYENDWYKGTYSTGSSGDTLRLVVVEVAYNVRGIAVYDGLEPTDKTFEACPTFGADGAELLQLRGRFPSDIIAKHGLDRLRFTDVVPEFL